MARLAAQPRLTRPVAENADPGSTESTQNTPRRTDVAARQVDRDETAVAPSVPADGGAATGSPSEVAGAADPAEAPDSPQASAEPRTPASRRTSKGLVAAAVLVLVALGAAIWAGIVWGLGAATESDREAALAAGRQAAVNLISVNFNTADADIKRVQDSSTGDFGSLFGQNLDSYAGIVKQAKVTSTGDVAEAGVQSLDGDTATVLAAVQSKVQNNQNPQGETRQYRMAMTMQKTDGDWKVAKMEFIP